MVDPQHAGLSITRQCRLVSITRSSFYYASRGDSPLNLRLMRRIDEQFLETPFYGSRQMTRWLRRQGDMVSRKRVRRLMRLLGVHALFQRPRTSQPHPAHRIYPYLLRDLQITRPNHRVVHGCHLHSPAAGLSVPGCRDGLGEPQGAVLAPRARPRRRSAHRACWTGARALWPSGDLQQRPGQPNSPASTSLTCSRRLAFASRWTARVAGWTTCSSSGCGDRSSTSASTCLSSRLAPRPGPASAGGWTSTTGAGPTRRSTTGRRPRRILTTGLTGAGRYAPVPVSPRSLES